VCGRYILERWVMPWLNEPGPEADSVKEYFQGHIGQRPLDLAALSSSTQRNSAIDALPGSVTDTLPDCVSTKATSL
jgi:hypothetical protein